MDSIRYNYLKVPSNSSINFDTPNRENCDEFGKNKIYDEKFVLGRGAYGKVLRAVYKNRDVAVKILQKSNCIKYESLKQEANIMNLKHENIIGVLKIVDCKTYGAVISERFDGCDLQNMLDNQTIDLIHRLHILVDITKGLMFCHEHEILHLDLKPQNIFVALNVSGNSERDYVCKLFDFGCSRSRLNKNEHYENAGTARYCAPEILQNLSPDCKADIFSLAIIMWQMKENQIPYGSVYPNETVIWNVVKNDMRPDSLKVRFLSDESHNLKRPRSSLSDTQCRSESSFLKIQTFVNLPSTPKSINRMSLMVPQNLQVKKPSPAEKSLHDSYRKNKIDNYKKQLLTRKRLFNTQSSPNGKVGAEKLFVDHRIRLRSSESVLLVETEYVKMYKDCWKRERSQRYDAVQVYKILRKLIDLL